MTKLNYTTDISLKKGVRKAIVIEFFKELPEHSIVISISSFCKKLGFKINRRTFQKLISELVAEKILFKKNALEFGRLYEYSLNTQHKIFHKNSTNIHILYHDGSLWKGHTKVLTKSIIQEIITLRDIELTDNIKDVLNKVIQRILKAYLNVIDTNWSLKNKEKTYEVVYQKLINRYIYTDNLLIAELGIDPLKLDVFMEKSSLALCFNLTYPINNPKKLQHWGRLAKSYFDLSTPQKEHYLDNLTLTTFHI